MPPHSPGLLSGLELKVREQRVILDSKGGDSEGENMTSGTERLVWPGNLSATTVVFQDGFTVCHGPVLYIPRHGTVGRLFGRDGPRGRLAANVAPRVCLS